jgi:hypothetical protein
MAIVGKMILTVKVLSSWEELWEELLVGDKLDNKQRLQHSDR